MDFCYLTLVSEAYTRIQGLHLPLFEIEKVVIQGWLNFYKNVKFHRNLLKFVDKTEDSKWIVDSVLEAEIHGLWLLSKKKNNVQIQSGNIRLLACSQFCIIDLLWHFSENFELQIASVTWIQNTS